MSGGDALQSPKPLRRSTRRSPPEAAATPTRPIRRRSGPSTPGRRGRSRSRTRRSPSTAAAAAQGSPAASSSGSPQTPRTAFEAIQVGASEEKEGRRVGGRMLVALLLLVAAAAAVSGVLLSAGARRAVSEPEPEPAVVEPAVAAPSAPLFVAGDARKKAVVAVKPEEKTPDPVAEQEPAGLPALEAAPAVAVEEKEEEDKLAAATAPEQPPPRRRQNASIPNTAAVPTHQQHLDAEKEAFTQRTAKQQSAPHPFFGAAVDKASRAGTSAATAAAAAAAAREDHTASAAPASTAPVSVAAGERAAAPSADAKGAKTKDAAATKSRRKAKQQQAASTAAAGTGQDRTAPLRPRTVLRVGEALLPGGKMGNRCFDFGPSGFCAPSTYLALDGSGRLELREGWETTSGGNGKGKEPPLPGKRKWQARRRVRWGKLLQKGLGRLKGQEEEAGGSYRLRLSENGMLELLTPDGEWVWRSGVEGVRNTTYEAFVSDEGKLVIFRGPQVHWRSA